MLCVLCVLLRKQLEMIRLRNLRTHRHCGHTPLCELRPEIARPLRAKLALRQTFSRVYAELQRESDRSVNEPAIKRPDIRLILRHVTRGQLIAFSLRMRSGYGVLRHDALR